MANRVPLIVDTTNLHLKELPLGDSLDLTGCGIVGLSSFTPGTGGGFRFIGITTFGDGQGTNIGAGLTGVYVNDGLQANYLKATNLVDNYVVTAGAGGTLTSSSDLTYDGSTLAVTGAITASTNLTVTGNATVNGNVDLGDATSDTITATGRFDSDLVPSTDGARDLGASGLEWKDLYVDGTANIDALVADSAKISDLTDNRVVIAGSAGELEDSGNLTFDGSTLTVVGDIAVSGNLNYSNVTDIYSVGIITAASSVQVGAGLSVVGVSTFNSVIDANDTTQSTSTTTGAAIFSGGVGIAKKLHVGLEVNSEDLNIAGISTLNDTKVGGGLTVTGASDLNSTLDVASTSVFNDDVTFTGANYNALWDKSKNALILNDNTQLNFGTDEDGDIYHDDANMIVNNAKGTLKLRSTSIHIAGTGNEKHIVSTTGIGVTVYYNDSERVQTTSDGTDFGGTGAIGITKGTTAQRPGSPAAGDFRYNTTTSKFEGYTTKWGAIGGGSEEVDNIIATASATGVGTFAKADYRAASIRALIDQSGSYQVGRYLLIHDGTTVTVVEEAAIATGSMLGTFDGVINGSNVEFKVTMGSAGIATVTTLIDKITV